MFRTCATEGCDQEIPAQSGRGKPRKFCLECRPPRNPVGSHVIALPTREPTKPSPNEPPLVETYRRQLAEVERLDTPEGAHVMHLVKLLVNGEHTASGAASLSRELRAAMELAVRDAGGQGDVLDEIAARRAQKAGSA